MVYKIALRFEKEKIVNIMTFVVKIFYEWGFFNDYLLSSINLLMSSAMLQIISGVNLTISTVFSIVILILMCFIPLSTFTIV